MRTLQEAETYCNSFITPENETKERTLKRIKKLMDSIGNPQKKFSIIHVGGSSGKSSTAYMTATILEHAGLIVGLHIKPHLQSITERCCINRTPITDADFVLYVNKIKPHIDTMTDKPTYFEVLVAIILWYFADHHVDIAVMEVGRGGRVDATNISSSALFVLTTVSRMHTDILGSTLKEITKEKMGIVKDAKTPVITGVTQPTLQTYIQHLGTKMHVAVTIVDTKKNITPNEKNVVLAVAAAKKFTPITDTQLKNAFSSMQCPGRMEIRTCKGHTLIMDNAKTNDFILSLHQRFPNKKMRIVLPPHFQKNTKKIVNFLFPLASEFICVSFPQKKETTGDRENFNKIARRIPVRSVDISKFQEVYLKKNTHDIFFITGSMEFIGAIRTSIHIPFALK